MALAWREQFRQRQTMRPNAQKTKEITKRRRKKQQQQQQKNNNNNNGTREEETLNYQLLALYLWNYVNAQFNKSILPQQQTKRVLLSFCTMDIINFSEKKKDSHRQTIRQPVTYTEQTSIHLMEKCTRFLLLTSNG